MVTEGGVSRRALLIGSAGVLLTAFTWQDGLAAPTEGVEPVSDLVDVFVSPSAVQPIPRVLGFAVKGGGPAITRFEVEGDLSSYEERETATFGEGGWSSAGPKIKREAGGAGSELARVDMAGHMGDGQLIIGSLETERQNWATAPLAVPQTQTAIFADGTRARWVAAAPYAGTARPLRRTGAADGDRRKAGHRPRRRGPAGSGEGLTAY